MNGKVLKCGSGASAFSAIGAETKDANGIPVRKYIKQGLRTGRVFSSTGAFDVTPAFLDKVVTTFQAMRAKGIKVPVQAGHNMDPEKTRGYVEDVYRDGDRLMFSVSMIGADSIALASRSEVSVFIESEFSVDGTTYTDALIHLACVPDPAVPNLGGFVRIAASRGQEPQQTPVYTARSTIMDWKDLAKILGLDVSGLDDTTGPERVKAALAELVSEKNKTVEMQASLTAAQSEATAAKSELATLKASRGTPEIDADVLEESAANVASQIDGLHVAGKINAAQKTALSDLLVGKEGNRPKLCLSRKAATHAGLPARIADGVLAVFGAATPITRGEKTGSQTKTEADKAAEKELADGFSKMASTY